MVDDRVVQVDRKTNNIRNAAAIKEKYGVIPAHIPDFLALVGDTADGYPGITGIGKKGAATMIAKYGSLEDWPLDVLGARRESALLYKRLATLRTDAQLFKNVDELHWTGSRPEFAAWCGTHQGDRLLARVSKIKL